MFGYNLKDIREQFVNLSGRLDLVVDTTDYEDNGANFYIRAGQKVLDTLLDTPQSSEEREFPVSSGDYTFSIKEIRAIEKIWVKNNDGEWQVEKKDMEWIRYMYGYGQQMTDVDTGRPLYYAIYRRQDSHPLEFKHFITFMPPADNNYTIVIQGMYYSDYLEKDTDTNFWTIEHPHTLIQSAMYIMERMYRNTEGANDHLNSIRQDLVGIDYDVATQNAAGRTQMKNSW